MTLQPARLPRPSLALWVAAVCLGVIVYASLQPFTGWVAPEPPVRYFLWHWGQRWAVADAVFNVAAYVPLGAALVIAWPNRWSLKAKIAATLVLAAMLSIGMETAQMWLPSRDASVRDVLANSVGAFVGTLLGASLIAFRPVTELATCSRNL